MSTRDDPQRLFDSIERVDERPALHTESRFSFLNRSAGDQWQRVREKMEGYFATYSTFGVSDLRERFRSSDDRQHISAWWELYIFTLLHRSGYEVQLHPELPNSDSRPDFMAIRQGEHLYLEATVVFSGVEPDEENENPSRAAWIFDLTNMAQSAEFMVGLNILKHGTERPAARDLVPRLERWLSGLDPDSISADIAAGDEPPVMVLDVRDWTLEYEAIPLDVEHRGRSGRLLGMYGIEGGDIRVDDALRKALRRKAKKYRDLDFPLVLAAMMEPSFSGDDDAESALLGPKAIQYYEGVRDSPRWVRLRNGLWARRDGPSARHVSAAIVSVSIEPWTHHLQLPKVWLNPWAERPIVDLFGLPLGLADSGGAISYRDGTRSAATVFGLPGEWPRVHAP